jgi:hypothetical protein
MSSDILQMKCECGSEDCRKFISGSDWMDEGLQKKYDGYFQPYLQKKIAGSLKK